MAKCGLLVAVTLALAEGYVLQPGTLRIRSVPGCSICLAEPPATFHDRRSAALIAGAFLVLGRAGPAEALVKGVAPPEGYGRGGGKKDLSLNADGKKITNKQEALEIGREREAALFSKEDGKFSVTEEGDRYRDEKVGEGEEVGEGSVVNIKYRVLRLGKRSRDGLSGEASLIFSFGYGEDDDKESDMLAITIGETALVPALESAIYGMNEGGKRRISVRPERGWRKSDANCGGRDIGKTVDVGTAIGLPGGAVTETESCMDNVRIPGPKTFQAIFLFCNALNLQCCRLEP